MLVEKKQFHLEKYILENGFKIPVTLGYETYGTLNEAKDNVILVSHYFSASSHAAGKYTEEDLIPGYWDELIGPGKAVDTNKFFVISTDNLANVQYHNPNVITTGPRSINPETGKRWGLDFPAYTLKDIAGIQREFLISQLGITKLYAVMGASAGGMISLSWAVEFPEMVERVIGVITNPQNPVLTSFSVLQHAMRVIAMDKNWHDGNYEDDQQPLEGLELAVQMMNTGAFSGTFYEETYPRDSFDDEPYKNIHTPNSYEKALAEVVGVNLPLMDASHWYYTSRATMMHDVAHGYESLEAAFDRISSKVLMISCVQDMIQQTVFNERMVDYLKGVGKEAQLVKIDSNKGHMAGVLESPLFAKDVADFLHS
ncbi:alpha/beta fold hydrolase [Enterococcus sp. LJL120]